MHTLPYSVSNPSSLVAFSGALLLLGAAGCGDAVSAPQPTSGQTTATWMTSEATEADEDDDPLIIEGLVEAGELLTVDLSAWDGVSDVNLQWLRCDSDGEGCQPIAHETVRTYTVDVLDVGHSLRIEAEAIQGGERVYARSAPTELVPAIVPINMSAPSIHGETAPGSELMAFPGAWEAVPAASYAYQWQRCASDLTRCEDIRGAAARSYTVAPDDVGQVLQVVVTASNDGGHARAESLPIEVLDTTLTFLTP